MTHPARRRAALPPARRGMRTPWLRRRVPEELGAPDRADVEPAPGDASPEAEIEAPVPPASTAVVTPGPVRPAFGHPTF